MVVGTTGGNATLVLEPINENFERGYEDWAISPTASHGIRTHIEGLSPWICRANCLSSPATAPGGELGSAAATSDDDLLLGNDYSPVNVTLTRTIRVEPGTSSLKVRYRLMSNAQSGWFRITVSAPNTAATAQYTNTAFGLQQLGLATGGTRDIQSGWLELALNMPAGAQDARIEVELPAEMNPPNNGVWLEIDKVAAAGISMNTPAIQEWKFDVTRRLVVNTELQFLSLGPRDGNNSGVTGVWGQLSVNGAAPRTISSVTLELRSSSAGAVRRSVPIRADAGATLLGQPFASDTLSTGAVRELFTFTDQDMQTVPTGPGEEFVYLAVKAKDDLGADIPVNGPQPKRVRKLTDVAQTVTRYNSPGSRDSGVCLGTTWPCRGDAWARPAFHQIMATAQQALSLAVPNGRSAYPIEFDDFSNINAGYYPPHNFHNEGRHVDGQIDGYATKDAALAIKMVEVAREIHTAMTAAGTTFTAFQILVEFNKSNPADPFRVELMNHTIGGKPALDYFVNGGKLHRSHFHVQMY